MPLRECFRPQFITHFKRNAKVRLRPLEHEIKPRWISFVEKSSAKTPNVSVALQEESPKEFRIQVSADLGQYFENEKSNLISFGLELDEQGNLTGLTKNQITVYRVLSRNFDDSYPNIYKVVFKIKDNLEIAELEEIYWAERSNKSKPKFELIKNNQVFEYFREEFINEGLPAKTNWINTAMVYLSKHSGLTAEEAIKTTLF